MFTKFPNCFISFCLLITPLYAKNLGVIGKTFEIKEQNFLTVIQERLKVLEKGGNIVKHQETIQKKVIEKALNPQATYAVQKTSKPSKRLFDPTITLESDIKNQEGKILWKKGTKINPLDFVSFGEPLIFIDGDDDQQVSKAFEEKGKIILLKGNPFTLMKRHKKQVYFDQGGILQKKFSLTHVPCRISQQDKTLLIEEVVWG